MSTRAKVALGTAIVAATTMISYVTLKQEWERERLHEGVVKDLERQRLKRLQKENMTHNKNDSL